MRKFNSTIVFLISLLSAGLIASANSVLMSSKGLPTQGTIDYGGHPGSKLLYSTSFESVTGSGSSGTDWIRDPLKGMNVAHCIMLTGTGEWWMEGLDETNIPQQTGSSRCLGQSLTGGSRNEVDIWDEAGTIPEMGWAGSETFYYQAWRYFASDFAIPNGMWYSMFEFDDSFRNYHPFVGAFLIGTSDPAHPKLGILWSNEGTGGDYTKTVSWTIPRGQWFKIGFYIERGTLDTYDASAKLYINDVEIVSASGIFLKSSINNSSDELQFCIIKMYTATSLNTKMWTDDVEIWNGMPGAA